MKSIVFRNLQKNLKARQLCMLTTKDVMQGKLLQKCTHLLYCNVLSANFYTNVFIS